MNYNLCCHLFYISLHVTKLFAAHWSDFWHAECPWSQNSHFQSCCGWDASLVSLMFQCYSTNFILKRTNKGWLSHYSASLLVVHKAHWKLHLTISILLLLSRVESGLHEFHLWQFNHFPLIRFVFPRHWWGLLSDCGMKVNVRKRK